MQRIYKHNEQSHSKEEHKTFFCNQLPFLTVKYLFTFLSNLLQKRRIYYAKILSLTSFPPTNFSVASIVKFCSFCQSAYAFFNFYLLIIFALVSRKCSQQISIFF